jgi:hypothetical protein
MINLGHIGKEYSMCAKGWNYNSKIVSNGKVHEISIKHPLYRLRYTILTRCYNAAPNDFPYYQGKGIKVCDEWKLNPSMFYQWCLDNNWKVGLALDRIDSSKDYSPDNCQFLGKSENLVKMHIENPMNGEKGPNSKLTDNNVFEIRKLLEMGVTCTRIGKDFGVSKSAIQAIKSKQNWRF